MKDRPTDWQTFTQTCTKKIKRRLVGVVVQVWYLDWGETRKIKTTEALLSKTTGGEGGMPKSSSKKSFAKMVLKEKYINYKNAKILLNLDSLEEQRHILCLKFEKNGMKNNNLNDLFPENDKIHKMKTRAVEKYQVKHANT